MGVYYIGSIPCSGGDIYHYGRKGMKWGKNIFGKISEFFTGNNARRELASATAQRNGARQQARALQGTPIGNAASSKQGWSHTSNFGPINGKNYKMIYGTGEEQRRAVAQENYNRTLPGMMDQARNAMSKAREQVSKAYANAASSLSGKGLDIQSFYSQVMQKAQGAINQGKNMVSKYGGQFVSQIQNLGSKALEGGKAFLDNAMERARNAGRKIGEAAGNAREFVTGEKARKKRDHDRSIYEKNSAAYEQEQSKKTKSPWSASHKSIVDKSKKRADESQAEYERTLSGMIERTARDAGERVSSTAKTAGRKAKKAKRDVTDYITGNRPRYELNRAKAAERGANTQHRLASMYDYEDVDNNGSVLNRASRDDYYARERRAQAQAAYDKTLPGQIEKAKKKRKK